MRHRSQSYHPSAQGTAPEWEKFRIIHIRSRVVRQPIREIVAHGSVFSLKYTGARNSPVQAEQMVKGPRRHSSYL